MALTMDFQGQIWNSRISGMGGPIKIEKTKGCESAIYDHDHDLLVANVRCKDLPDSDRVTLGVDLPSTHLGTLCVHLEKLACNHWLWVWFLHIGAMEVLTH